MNLAVEQADRRRSVRLRRGEAIAITPQLWTRTVSELCARPPRNVFLFDGFVTRHESGDNGAPMSLLRQDYAPAERARDGEWFRLVGHSGDAGVCLGIAQPLAHIRRGA